MQGDVGANVGAEELSTSKRIAGSGFRMLQASKCGCSRNALAQHPGAMC